MSMSLAELIPYCLIDPQTALIHHRVIQYLISFNLSAPHHNSIAQAITGGGYTVL